MSANGVGPRRLQVDDAGGLSREEDEERDHDDEGDDEDDDDDDEADALDVI